MLQGKPTRRIIAATLLTIMLTNTLAPTVSYALTSGPTAPEATSFEPIDTTDMVNLQTGNFTYNLPLLEVPGPEGGYPLSLSYHAGIQTNEDASWVGLGWTLNPGAINRSVNGYPDDWNGVTSNSQVYWAGGTKTTYTPGLSIGLANTPFSVNAGLSFSNDTYQGFGMSMDVGVGISGILGNSPLLGNINIGISSDGQGSVSGGVGASYISQVDLSGSIGANVSTNFESLETGFTGGMGISGGSLLQASMSTNGDKPSLTAGGYTSTVSSSSEAQVQTKSSGWHIDIPTPVPGLSASFGYSKTRYFINDNTNVTTNGSIYNNYANQDNVAYDNYSLLLDPSENNYIDNPDPTAQQGGAYLAFDNYDVNAQGLSGSMRPYQFQGVIFGQNLIHNGQTCTGVNCDGYQLHYYGTGTPSANPTPRFRFVNDFSNKLNQENKLYADADLNSSYLKDLPIPFTTPVTGDGTNGDGFKNNQLAGSKHIDVGIKVKPSQLLGYNTNRLGAGMIEGFSITNSSGVMYTFGLPAYSYGEESYQQKRNQPADKPSFNRQKKQAAYAYAWYLTSITGPDFVDRNGNGMADAGDWGYWVNFEYGKWSDNYAWRTPSEGYNVDEDNEWQNCSMGYKEVYYLNAIRTRTHVALFEKDTRPDAKGSSPTIFDKNGGDKQYLDASPFDGQSVSSLRLSHIYLMNASDGNIVTPSSGTLSGNVLDASDIEAVTRSGVEAKALRIIDFNHDYTLCTGTSNSFYTPGQLLGKLTLKSISTRGNGGQLFPPMKFDYEAKSDALVQADVQLSHPGGLSPTYFVTSNDKFKVGDMIMSPALNTYLGVIVQKNSGSGLYAYYLMNGTPPLGQLTLTVRTTKNPPYNKDAYDSWGMYKSDINKALLANDVGQARTTNDNSAQNTDAWSLRSITTELGNKIKVNYESDSYFVPETDYNKQSLMIQKIDVDKSAGTMVLTMNNGGDNTLKLSNSYAINDDLSALLLMDYLTPTDDDGNTAGGLIADTRTKTVQFYDEIDNFKFNLGLYQSQPYTGTLTVIGIDDVNNKLTVQCTDQFLLANQKKVITIHAGTSSNLSTEDVKVVPSHYWGGNLFIKANNGLKGGGVRVSSLAIEEPFTGVVNTTNYEYDSQGKTSGVSTYSANLPQPYFNFPATQTYAFEVYQGSNVGDGTLIDTYTKFYKRTFLSNNSALFTLSRDIPPPGVMYGDVTVSSYIKNPAETNSRKIEGGKTEYQFEVFKNNMVARIGIGTKQQGIINGNYIYNQYARYYSIYRFVSCLGNTKRIIHYDEYGQKLSETINNYLHDGLLGSNTSPENFLASYKQLLTDKFNGQGYINERYGEVKSVGYQKDATNNGMKATISQKEELPCISTGQTVINYVNGTSTTTDNVAYDFYSGDLTKSVETDTYGNQFMTETVPAYRAYPNTELGLKINGTSNLNMLTQVAAKYLYKVEKNSGGTYDNKGYVSAAATTWGNGGNVIDADGNSHIQNNATDGNIWRIQSSYNWKPNGKTVDGLTVKTDFTPLNYSNPGASAPGWKKASEVTLYDVYSHSQEGRDMNGNYAAMRMDDGNKRVIMSANLARFDEIAYSGAEDASVDKPNDMFVKRADGLVSTDAAHTGSKSLRVGVSGKKGFVYNVSTNKLTAGRTYLANVWVKPVSGSTSNVNLYYEINGVQKGFSKVSSGNSKKTANGWALVDLVIDGNDITPGATLTVYGRNDAGAVEAYLDDFRFRPLNSTSSSYVYDAFTGVLTHILDKNNLYTKYEYDAAGRLARVYHEKLGVGVFKTNEYQYNWGHAVFVNDPINRPVTKNNCAPNTIPSSVQVNIPGGLFTSYVSKDDANAQANVGAQDQANTGGTCNLIYARLVFQNTYSIGSTTYGDIAVYFYSNAACTQPYNVSSILVNWTDWFSCDDSACGEESTTPHSALVSGNSAVLESNLYLSGSGSCYCSLDSRLSSGLYNIVFQ